MTWANDVRRAKETLDWIEARQGPLKLDGYARVETTVAIVRQLWMSLANGTQPEATDELE